MKDDILGKAVLLSAHELPKFVETAVQVTQKRLGNIGIDGENIRRWELKGRQLRELAHAQPFAESVVAELRKSGVAAEPAVLVIGGEITAGFVDARNLPQLNAF